MISNANINNLYTYRPFKKTEHLIILYKIVTNKNLFLSKIHKYIYIQNKIDILFKYMYEN